jgi:hypothetical protein
MNRNFIRSGAAFTLLFLSAALPGTLPAWPQQPATALSSRENERRSFAIVLVRAINAAEVHYKHEHQVYANWETLFGNGDFSENGTKWASKDFPTVGHALYGSGAEIAPGWRLRLSLSNNGNSYDLLLEDVTDPKCSYAALTDERGLIRQSRAVACPL